jgi:predicted Zn-dependent protease
MIHQNMAERNTSLMVRAVVGKRVATAATNQLTKRDLRRAVKDAYRIACLRQEDPQFASLPSPRPIAEAPGFSQKTARCSPTTRAAKVGPVVRAAQRIGGVASGSVSTEIEELAIVNSLGVRAYHASTGATMQAIVGDPTLGEASGFGFWCGTDLAALDARAVARTAAEKCRRSRDPIALDPGTYEVVLEPAAVGEMLQALAYVGLGADSVREKRSFMCDRFGEKVMDEKISIWDDGFDPRGFPMPFDYEGVPKQRVNLIERGVAHAVVHDSYTARLAGVESTGHALPAPPNSSGPLPLHLVMGEGDATVKEMIAGVDRGLLVTRFHYINIVHPMLTTLTGMTRDGLWLIEKGRIKRPVKNLRFTQSIVEAFSHVVQVGSEAQAVKGWFDLPCLVPALHLTEFAFTS